MLFQDNCRLKKTAQKVIMNHGIKVAPRSREGSNVTLILRIATSTLQEVIGTSTISVITRPLFQVTNFLQDIPAMIGTGAF
jgi:hypothetical protein